ncbi:hypothetical protein BGX26_011200 [Mortierella sp. AD094]|nr:hypothetical protein BGX26_011200 [Mortierella sp. AD094]
MNGMTVQGVQTTNSTTRGETSVITVPSQTGGSQSIQSFLVLDRDGLHYASWGPSDDSKERVETGNKAPGVLEKGAVTVEDRRNPFDDPHVEGKDAEKSSMSK